MTSIAPSHCAGTQLQPAAQVTSCGGGLPDEAPAVATDRGLQVGEGAPAGDRAHIQ